MRAEISQLTVKRNSAIYLVWYAVPISASGLVRTAHVHWFISSTCRYCFGRMLFTADALLIFNWEAIIAPFQAWGRVVFISNAHARSCLWQCLHGPGRVSMHSAVCHRPMPFRSTLKAKTSSIQRDGQSYISCQACAIMCNDVTARAGQSERRLAAIISHAFLPFAIKLRRGRKAER